MELLIVPSLFYILTNDTPSQVAAQAYRAGVERLAHVSGIGADAASQSLYVRKRAEGELAIRATFADALLIRPAVMFGPDDAFLTIILKLLRRLPIYPMFGRCLTRLQPAFVEDVAEAVARALQGTETHAITYECGGPRVYSYEKLLRAVAHEAGLKPMLIPIPFAAWQRTGMDLGNAPESARHSESSGTDAGRQRVLAGDARIWTTWNFDALCRGDTPADVMESLIKELPRFEKHDRSCLLKDRLRLALLDQALTGNPTTYNELADRLGLEPPQTIHRLGEALETLMKEDVVANRPMLAALCVSKMRPGIPARGFFLAAKVLGVFSGDPAGPEARAFHADELQRVLSFYGS